MSQTRDITQDLERHRQVLEETVSNLRKQLQVWENWYIEYSHLKEEVTTLPEQPPSAKSLARIRRDFDSDLMTKKEINEIFGKNDLKKPEQILSVLTRRIDYVERNVETLEKQLEQAENKLAASSVIAEPDGVVDEESGLPITDIIEEIDEEGNVLNFRLQTGGDVGPEVLEALKSAGVDPLEEGKGKDAESEASKETPAPDMADREREVEGASKHDFAKSKTEAGPTSGPEQPKRNGPNRKAVKPETGVDDNKVGKMKSVSFSEKLEVSEFSNDLDEDDQPKSRAALRLEAIMQQAKELENMPLDSVDVPKDESDEDAQLRRDMLVYSASEIGPIVAELELDEGDSNEDDYEFDYTEDEDSEDELGRTKHSVINDDYIKRMQELEKRLGVETAFANERAQQLEVPVEGLGQIRVVRSTTEETARRATVHASDSASERPGKKGVRFAEELDIADETKAATVLPERPAARKAPEVNPISEIVTERTSKPTPPPSAAAAAAPTKKTSRFKKDRAAGAPTVPLGPLNAPVRFLDEDRSVAPTGPEGKTLADGVLEREPTTNPKDPDELDAALLHQEAAVEYHRMRNRMIQREGGFNKEDDRVMVPLEEEEGGPKKMSRFKAARLSRQ
jgi:unconventional prefoldin RPB5 interactor 1